jgi:TolA-binding protein
MGKIERQLTDLNNVIKALQAPAAAPPASPGMPVSGAGVPGPGDASAAGVPPVKATTLYENALKDKQSGKADLALGEFQDYIRFYHDTDAAAAAQYYIGEIHYSQEQYDAAIQDFDKVLEAYPNNNKTADAHYMKGKTLAKIGQRKAAAKEFLAVVTDFPHSDVAPQSRALLNRARVTAAQ